MSLSEFLSQYGLFVLQLLTAVLLLVVIIGIVVAIAKRGDEGTHRMNIEKLNDKFEQMRDAVNAVLLDKPALKALRREHKQRRKDEKKSDKERERIYVLDFKGDIRASATESLREEISAILSVANKGETVLLRLENPGGTVHEHGLAASQLTRLKARELNLIVAVDKVAASGGYLMACVADRIIAAPFAIVGSIGVLAQMPNFHRWLESRGIDFEQLTAGRFKRTLTVFGENTEEGREKLQAEIEEIHGLFKSQVTEHRPQLDIEQVATGEHWYGVQALALQLVDELKTSDEFLSESFDGADIFRFEYKRHKSVPERMVASAMALLPW